ncbi:hypothetical protein EBT16_08550 [bacterium]|nr:hypothetical protein [bacterium]
MNYLLLLFVPISAMAEDIVPPIPDEWSQIIVNLTKGELSVLAIVAAVVQVLMLLFRTKFGEKSGKFRLLFVSGLSLVGGVLGLKIQGMEWGSALVHSSTLAAMQVFGFELYKKLVVEKAPQPMQPVVEKAAPQRKAKK